VSNQTGTKRSNEVMALERRVAQLEALIKQIPSRFASPSPPRASRVVRVRFNFSYSDDFSEAELLTNAAATDQQTLVWIDGLHALTVMPPQDFGDSALYWAELTGTVTRIGGSPATRQLYRVTKQFSLSNTVVPEIQFEYTNIGNYGKLLTLAGSAIQTTLAGVGQDNRVPIALEVSSNGYRYDWTRRLRIGPRAVPDGGFFHAPGAYYRASSPMRSGCFIGINDSTIGGLSIDNAEPFRIDLWANSATIGGGFTNILIASQHTAAIMFSTSGYIRVVGAGGTIQMRYDNISSDRRAAADGPTWAGGTLPKVDITDDNGGGATIVLTPTFTNGRITAIASVLSSGLGPPSIAGMKYRIMITGGRGAPLA
jgi:hypothetical protein